MPEYKTEPRPARWAPDPRPVVELRDEGYVIRGKSCQNCGHYFSVPPRLCRLCRGELVDRYFGPTGIVWSSTVVRIPAARTTTPYVLAYVDLVEGPRILAHVEAATRRQATGQLVELTGKTPDGDPLVRPTA
jgi:uncharacterized OB-fold protein